MSPREAYRQALCQGEIEPDPAQEMTISHLQRLYIEYQEQTAYQQKTGFLPGLGGWLRRLPWFRARLHPGSGYPELNPEQDRGGNLKADKNSVKGLYLWGGVGRGKTWMMDLFYDTLPEPGKTRLHFHRFMRLVHRELKALQGVSDPLRRIARDFARNNRLLCFDEFFVSDITDAMILAGLLSALVDEGVILVATSNSHPDDLYKDGLQRSQFLPAIELIKRHTSVVKVDGDTDYRLRALESAEIYHFPLDSGADLELERCFKSISPDRGEPDRILEIEGRPIPSRYCGDGVVWFDFSDLCDGPRSQHDYMEIARIFQTVLVSNVPFMHERLESQARRFISLVDEFYERGVKLILSAEVAVDQLYGGSQLSFEFERTRSRLQEMMSHDYLAREHKP